MQASSARQKGRRLVRWVIENWKDLDPSAHEVAGSGAGMAKADVQLPTLEVAFEVKNHATWKMPDWIEQLKRESVANDLVALAIRDPATPEAVPDVYYVLTHDSFHRLIQERRKEMPSEDRLPKWKVRRAVEAMKELIKYLD